MSINVSFFPLQSFHQRLIAFSLLLESVICFLGQEIQAADQSAELSK